MSVSDINSRTHDSLLANFTYNSVLNFPRLAEEAKRGDISLSALPNVYNPTNPIPALIIGSGPSLDDMIDVLPRWRGAIFASPTNLMNLEAVGRPPHYICITDSDPVDSKYLRGHLSPDSVLLTHQCVDPELLDAWIGPKRYFKFFRDDMIWNNIQTALFPYLQVTMGGIGCVSNTMVQIADFLGYRPIILMGVDFGPVDGRIRAKEYDRGGAYRLKPLPARTVDHTDPSVYEFYYHSFFTIWKLIASGMRSKGWVLSCSKGMLKELPQVTKEQMINLQFPEAMEPKAIMDLCDSVTIPAGMYADIVPPGGVKYAESAKAQVIGLKNAVKQAESEADRWHKTEDGVWSYTPRKQ